MKFIAKLLLTLFLILALQACNKDEEKTTDIEIVNNSIYDLMKQVYLWYDHLPGLDPGMFSTPEELMENLRYTTYDKWSAVITKTEYNQYFEEGQMIGHGFLIGVDDNDNLRIAFVYRSTEAYDKGVRRGWIIQTVNGTAANSGNVTDLLGDSQQGVSNSIGFLNHLGETVQLTLTKEEIALTPVLHFEVVTHLEKKIGYLVFQDFIDTARVELDEAFTAFQSEGIDELVVDMRYNGGGSVDVAQYMAGWMIGKEHGNEAFVNFEHNRKLTSWDTTLNVPQNGEGLALNRIFFIGTSSTASASELIINGVKPYVQSVILAGSTTHGKPVGMYAFPFIDYDYVVLPVSFKYTNADGDGDFYTGLAPDLTAGDDLTHDFGDPEEESLKAILEYIDNGTVPLKSTRPAAFETKPLFRDEGINQYLRAY
jgi:C-terminal processing protease CtpA/Prc